MLRNAAQRLCSSLFSARVREWRPGASPGPAVVFSPHYDDETLGAGGAIIQLRQMGVPVYLVFLTDGSRSHAQAMDPAALSVLRREEALRAAAVLGVDSSCVRFLEFPETQLARFREQAVRRIAGLLEQTGCGCAFVPSTLEPLVWSADHRATTAAVFEALKRTGLQPEIMEYFVWFWYHWPWVPVLRTGDERQLLSLTWRGASGLKAALHINAAAGIGGVRSRKRQALDEYRSQMTRLAAGKPWPVLGDVARGEFLPHFFGSHEFYKRYSFAGGTAHGG